MKCPKCGAIHSRKNGSWISGYCNPCHAGYMREWRKTHPLTEEQRMKDSCRSYAGTYLRRGKIEKSPCLKCGKSDSQMHHEDYSKPLSVEWLCRPCHLSIPARETLGGGIHATM